MPLAVRDPLLDWAIAAWKREPELRIEDAYKWLFQATLGGEHAIRRVREAEDWLRAEWRTLGLPVKDEPLIVSLTPDGKLVRLNLRPFRAMGGREKTALQIFVQSARSFHGDRKKFIREWTALGKILSRSSLGHLNRSSWARLDRSVKKHGYPAIDHSQEYEKAAHPAYRVILRRLIAGTGE
jgi:hypothetical protein